MGRKGESRGADLPPGRRRDLQRALIELQREAGGFSQADIARYTGRSKSTVSNVFSGRKVQPRETVLDVTLALGMRLPASRTTQEQLLDELSERFRVLWTAAKAEEHDEPRGDSAGERARPPAQWHPRRRLPTAARQLLFSLTSVCAICGGPWPLDIHHILGLENVMEVAHRLGGQNGLLRAASHAANPWELIVLCYTCNYRATGGDISTQQLREGRLKLDRHPNAPHVYGRYLDQILLAEDKEFMDLNAVASAVAIAQRRITAFL